MKKNFEGRRRDGHYPLQVADGEVWFVDTDVLVIFGRFTTAEEVDQERALLSSAGISRPQTLGDEPGEDGIYWSLVEVSGPDLDHGLEVVAKGMCL